MKSPEIKRISGDSENKVQRQGQKGIAPALLAVTGDQQQKQHNDQIPSVESMGDQLP